MNYFVNAHLYILYASASFWRGIAVTWVCLAVHFDCSQLSFICNNSASFTVDVCSSLYMTWLLCSITREIYIKSFTQLKWEVRGEFVLFSEASSHIFYGMEAFPSIHLHLWEKVGGTHTDVGEGTLLQCIYYFIPYSDLGDRGVFQRLTRSYFDCSQLSPAFANCPYSNVVRWWTPCPGISIVSLNWSQLWKLTGSSRHFPPQGRQTLSQAGHTGSQMMSQL